MLWALEGGLHIRARNGVLFTKPRLVLADLRRGFLVVRSTPYQGEDDGAGRSLP